MTGQRIGEILVARNLVTDVDIHQALAYQQANGGRIGTALVRLGAIAEEDLLRALSEQLSVPVISREMLAQVDPVSMAELANRCGVRLSWWIANRAVVLQTDATSALCVAEDILKPAMRQVVTAALPGPVSFGLARRSDLDDLLEKIEALSAQAVDSQSFETDTSVAALKELAEQAPVIDFLNRVLMEAIESRASDIHIEPSETRFVVRMRTDGVLSTWQTVPRRLFDAVSTRVKLLSGMDIAERRLPQDGRQTIRLSGEDVDLRVSTLPAQYGESIVLRLLRKRFQLPGLEAIGMSPHDLRQFDRLLRFNNGVILVTGPTGSGKSTTLYKALDIIRDGRRKILTIEDPVEYEMAGVTQVQVKPDIGLTFAKGLRAILRQDPDIILVGEIRDGETASICAQAALTGHLVLSTLHTNSAAEAVSRLVDLGVEPFLIAASARGLIAQRLVRKLCDRCSTPASANVIQAAEAMLADAPLNAEVQLQPPDWREPTGCPACSATGFKGRIGVFEIVVVDDAIHTAILGRQTGSEIQALARAAGSTGMLVDGLRKARQGLTSVAEVLRVVGEAAAATALGAIDFE